MPAILETTEIPPTSPIHLPSGGTFSDASNDKAELKVKFVIDKETFCIKLLQYGTTVVKKGDETQYKNQD